MESWIKWIEHPAKDQTFRTGRAKMLRLRKVLCGTFGFLAIISSLVAYTEIWLLLRNHGRNLFLLARNVQDSPAQIALSVALWLLADMVRLMPLILVILCGMAWWSARKKKSSARGWALAASIAILFLVIPLSIAFFVTLRYDSNTGQIIEMALLPAIPLALGAGGVLAFAAKDSLTSSEIKSATRSPRIAGDGTSKWLDIAIWVVSAVGCFFLQSLWDRWGDAHHLPFVHGIGIHWWALLAAAILTETTIHESGHALVGIAEGMRLRAFIVWPFGWVLRHGQWRLQIQPGKIFNFGGATDLVPTNPRQPNSAYIAMIAAGPVASLLSGFVAFWVARALPGTGIEWAWEFFALVSTVGLVAFVVNLIPARPKEQYTDGALIYHLLAGGPWTDYHRAVFAASSGTVSPLRPRDYEIEAIRGASASIAQGNPGLLLRFLAYYHFRDCNQIRDACHALVEAESVCENSEIELSAQVCAHFVIGKAFVARDSVTARAWWDRMQSKKTKELDSELFYWEAKCALGIVEGNFEAASEAWEKGNAIAQQRPRAGAYDYDRDCFAEMHEAIQCGGLRECAVESAG